VDQGVPRNKANFREQAGDGRQEATAGATCETKPIPRRGLGSGECGMWNEEREGSRAKQSQVRWRAEASVPSGNISSGGPSTDGDVHNKSVVWLGQTKW
jgi:hypothetical protein